MKIKKQDKRRTILEAAKALFNRTHDVKRVSLEAIAEEAGVSPTTIYNHFGDRETLVFEVIKDLTSQQLERNRALVHSDLPFPQKIIGIINRKVEMTEQVNGEIIEKMVSQDKTIGPFIDEIYSKEIKPLWQEIMAQGKKEGYVDPELNDEALLIYLDIIQAGLRAKTDIFKDFQENLDLIEQLTRLMFFGFLKKEIGLFGREEKKGHA